MSALSHNTCLPSSSARRPSAGHLSIRRRFADRGPQLLLPPHCQHHPHSQQRCRRRTSLRVYSTSSWPSDDGPLAALLELRSKLKPLGVALRQAVQALWQAQRLWLQHALARMALGLGILAAAATLVANAWGVPAINRQLLPQVQEAASVLLQREVALGAVRWVAPTGLLGLTPLGSLGPVRVGPGPVEGSSAEVQRLTVALDPVQSALQGRVVLTVKARGAQVDLAQASNHSWFGFPEDTSPSARNFVPGLGRGSSGGDEGGGSTPSEGGTAGGGGSSHSAGNARSSAGTAGAENVEATAANVSATAPQWRMETAANKAASSSRQLQELLSRLRREMAVRAAGQAAQQSGAAQQQPTMLLMGLGSSASHQHTNGSDSISAAVVSQQQQQSVKQPQALVRVAPRGSPSGGTGIFGGKLGWPAHGQQPEPQPLPQSAPPDGPGQPNGRSLQQQQHVAALNALRLQAGRGYTLQQRQGQDLANASAGVVASSSKVAQRSLAPSPRELAQVEPQHRKLHRRRGLVQQQQEQQQQQLTAAATSSCDPSLKDPVQQDTTANASDEKPQRFGSAATLSKQLQSLETHRGKLYAVSPAHPLQQMEAEPAALAEAAADETTSSPAVLEGGAAAADPVMKMTAEQRREAVALINGLPAMVGTFTPPSLPPAAATSSSMPSNSSMADAIAADGQQGKSQRNTGAVRRVNRVGSLEAPDELKPSFRVNQAAAGGYGNAVVDPAVIQRKKLGSASLPWSHQRPPATALIGSRLGIGKEEPGHAGSGGASAGVATDSTVTAGAVGSTEGGSADDAAGTFQLLGEPANAGDADPDGAAVGKAGTSRRLPLLHPGYFTATYGPNYTPAPPEALIDARNRRSTLQTYVRMAVDAASNKLRSVEVALGGIQVQGATVDAHVHGEELPRRFQDLAVNVRLGPSYDTLSVDLTASPHERLASSAKCTMPSPHAHRHLRDSTGIAAMRTYGQQGVVAGPEQAADGSSGTSSASAAYNGRPTGGRLRVRVDANGITSGAVPPAEARGGAAASSTAISKAGQAVPTLDIRVEGQGLHAPLIERLIELPMDINAGRADGELRIYSHDAASWHFPEFFGRVNVRDANFHFWDATDDINSANLDLLFERDRLYLHNTSGRFGTVPMTLAGDLDLNPVVGQYRLSATVPGVEVNQLRATLGVRPTPQPVAGSLAGVLHVTGPLEKPVFSGSAWAVRPDAEQLADCEQTDALAAMLAEPGAVGAWDRVPLSSAGAVFELDTAKERFELHSAHGVLADGGQLRGSGSMWVAPRAEMDPSAVSLRAEGHDLAAEAVARRYLPEGVSLPPGMVLGHASLTASLQGSHLEPTLEVAAQLPEASASCTAQLRRTAAQLTMSSPHADTTLTAHLLPPSFENIKMAVTQAQATALAKPNVAGLDGEVGLRGLDVVPLMSVDGEAALRQLAAQSGQPLRLKLNGRAKVSGMVQRQEPVADGQGAAAASAPGSTASQPGSWVFAGDLGLESMRVNQLKLFQKLAGRLSVSTAGISIHGKGMRASETLDLDLALPLPASVSGKGQQELAGSAGDMAGGSGEVSAGDAVGTAAAAEAMAERSEAALDQVQVQAPVRRGGGSGLQMRCGPLQVAADINAAGSQLDFKVAALKLDELELASLRGDLQEVSCSLNFDTHTGRGKVSLANPRYSGLRGDSLSGGFRWERDVVRLEKLVVQQQRSRYEMQGEYSLPPNTPLPSSAAELALPALAGDAAAAGGRWRMQVSVPWAELQEIVPAARLLQSATSLSPAEYERAKSTFLQAIEQSSIKAAELNTQLRLMAERVQPTAPNGTSVVQRQNVARGGADLHLPGLQDMRGQWSGSIQAYGGGGSATSCDFDVKGQSWQWGTYALDALAANGSYHSEEGVQLQEVVLKAGGAKLSLRGSLLGEHQDASLLLTDFPMATLRPIFRAVPALQHAAPAVPAERPQPVASPRPLGMLTNVVGRATKGLGLPGSGLSEADSPINGLLYVSGNIAGSRAQPTGEVAVHLYDAAVGQTRLSTAQASARLNDAQLLSFNVEVVPAEGHRQAGYVRAGGMLPLADASSTAPSASKAGDQQMDVRLSVKDGGMALLTSITPDLRWQGGLAAIDVRLRGTLEQPQLSGSASISRATLDCPLLRFPLTNTSAEVRAGGGMLTVESLEARCGRRGHIRARGSLPQYSGGDSARSNPLLAPLQQMQQHVAPHRLLAEASALELRLRNLYSGQYDSSLTITNSLATPTVAGSMRFSKGIVFIVPQGSADVAGTASASSKMLLTPSGTGLGGQAANGGGASVAKVFGILTRGESGVAQQFEAVMKQEVEAVEHIVEDAGQHNVSLDRLSICLGPDLRAMYPLVMNFGVEGELAVSGPAHPDQVRVTGTVRLPSGDVNLVATQLALDREHANLITFQPDQSGLDPLVDMVMNGGDLRVAIKGKASEWQERLTLHYSSNKSRPDSGEQLDAADAARLFEDKLKAALLAEDGQLALSRLAGTTVSTLMPKIETQGEVGGTRWRLVSAPSIPGLLSLDPSLADPSNILSSITMGTEVEVQFGKKLQAAMIRKLQESDVTTQWSLNYKLNSKLRMQFNITSAPPFPKTLMFQYSDI